MKAQKQHVYRQTLSLFFFLTQKPDQAANKCYNVLLYLMAYSKLSRFLQLPDLKFQLQASRSDNVIGHELLLQIYNGAHNGSICSSQNKVVS